MSLSRNWIGNCKSVGDQCWEVVHPWDKSCCRAAVGMFLTMYPRCVQVYFPLFLVSISIIAQLIIIMLHKR